MYLNTSSGCFQSKTQEPSPAKMAATESSFPSCEKAPESSCAQWQEELRGSGPGLTPMWTDTDTRPLDSERPPAGAAQSTRTHTHAHMHSKATSCPLALSVLTSCRCFI